MKSLDRLDLNIYLEVVWKCNISCFLNIFLFKNILK